MQSPLYIIPFVLLPLFSILFLNLFLPHEIQDVVERARLLGFTAENDSPWGAFIKHLVMGSQGTVIRRTGVWIIVMVRISSLALFGSEIV